jgi:hypothetical protein
MSVSVKSTITKCVLISATVLFGCNGGTMNEKRLTFTTLDGVTESAWEKLSEQRIYFGHQSVGFNIIQGINGIMKENPQIRLKVIETNDPADMNKPIFAHSSIGENTYLQTKIDDFASFMEKGIGEKADITFFKLCFADIIGTTDVNRIFEAYKNTMSHLKKEYPQTTFVHVTVPLLRTKITFKNWIKRALGKKDIWGLDGNIKRNEFNNLLRKEYKGEDPIFDLAIIESTYPDGKRSSFTVGGKTYDSLVPEYTHDGGHLNERGRKIVAEQLLIFLANLSQQTQQTRPTQ